MNVTLDRPSPGVTTVLLAVLAGILVRIAIFVNDFYYPDVGMPYTLGLPLATIVVVGTLVFLVDR